MTLQLGQVLINRYRIVKLVGQGGFGAVYRAWDLALRVPVALKENLDTSGDAQRQFEHEAQLLAPLRHPNLPRVSDHFFLPSQGQYLVMDFVEGKSLDALLAERRGPLSEAEALNWIGQVCDALEYLHSRRPPIIHRDIKPQNIIITTDGRAMLVDFGISKAYDPLLATTRGAQAVTPGYSPPEQYGQGKTDARSDVYALGATLYTLLTGQPPPESVVLMTGDEQLMPVRAVNRGVSQATEGAIAAAMVLPASRRLGGVAALKDALAGRAAATPPPVAQTITVAPAKSGGRGGVPVWLLALAGIVAIAIIGVGVWFLRDDSTRGVSPIGDDFGIPGDATVTHTPMAIADKPTPTIVSPATVEEVATMAIPTAVAATRTLPPLATAPPPTTLPPTAVPATATPFVVTATAIVVTRQEPTEVFCPGASPSRLAVGDTAQVVNYQLNVRAGPSTSEPIVGRLEVGRTMEILDGPACDDGQLWFRIRSEVIRPRDGRAPFQAEGWSVEESGGDYFLEPVD